MLVITQFVDDAVWYVPDIGDNREQEEERQFMVLISPMNARDLRKAEEGGGKLGKGKINFIRRHNAIRARVLTKCIHEVANCFFEEIRGGEKSRKMVLTSEALCKVAGEDILEDIFGAIKDQSQLAEGLAKKSQAQSSSTVAQPKSSGLGAAQNATLPSSEVDWETPIVKTLSYDAQTVVKDG